MSTPTYEKRTTREIAWLKKTWFQCHCTFVLHTAEGFDFHREELKEFEKEWRSVLEIWEEDPVHDLYDHLSTKFLPYWQEIKAIQEDYYGRWECEALSNEVNTATELGMSPQGAEELVKLKTKVRHLEKRLEHMWNEMPIKYRKAF